MSSESQERSPSQRIDMVLNGSKGRLARDPFTFLARGRGGRDVLAVWLRGGVYCDDRVMGPNWLKKRVKKILHAGGEFIVGQDCWPARYEGGRFR